MDVTVIGCGYVGLTTGVVLTSLGHTVTCVDRSEEIIRGLTKGTVHFREPGLPGLVSAGLGSGRLSFATKGGEAVRNSDIVLICVGSPSGPDGAADTSQVDEAFKEIVAEARSGLVVALKSTVPVGTCRRLAALAADIAPVLGIEVVSNPEFLREGRALSDAMNPDRIVIGSDSARATHAMIELYYPLHAPFLIVSPAEAEFIKYAANAFLATKVSFINELAELAEASGVDICRVARGIGLNPRIGQAFLKPGIGFGGPCLPKDLRALVAAGKSKGVAMTLLQEVERVNLRQRERAIGKLESALGGLAGKTIAVWGLTFKGGTGDIRESPSVELALAVARRGATVRCYDPAVAHPATLPPLTICESPYAAVTRAHALAVLTDWDEFARLDLARVRQLMTGRVVFDGRNVLSSEAVRSLGFDYVGMGR